MANGHISTLKMKIDQLELALESESIYSQSKAFSSVYDICKYAILSLPEIIEVPPDFYESLKALRPNIKTEVE